MIIWKPIIGYEQYYLISDTGVVKSNYSNKILKPSPDKDGYFILNLYKDRKKKTYKIHKLVVENFLPPKQKSNLEIRHINGDNQDNRLENLSWSTKSKNNLDRVIHKTHHQTKKDLCPRGHKLEIPNLILATYPKKRQCKSCSNAQSFIRTHPEIKLQEESDKRYRKIMQK